MNAPTPVILTALLIGCSQPTLSPTRALLDDPMVTALPPGVTLIGGVDMTALDDSWIADAFTARTGVAPSAAPSLAGAKGAFTDRMVFACGEHGCLGLAEGDMGDMDWCAVADRRGADLPDHRLRCSADDEPGLDATLPMGEPVALRQLSPTKLVMGDRAAVRNAYPLASGRGEASFDPAALEGLVPQGALWMAAYEPGQMALQAARRLDQNGSAQAAAMASQLRDMVDCCSEQLEDVVAVALAVDDLDGLQAVLRVTCRDAWTARAVERAMDRRLDRALEEGAPTWLGALSAIELVRAGATVELRGHGTREAFEAWVSTTEASP